MFFCILEKYNYLKNNININPIIKNMIVVFFLLYLIAVGNNSLNEI